MFTKFFNLIDCRRFLFLVSVCYTGQQWWAIPFLFSPPKEKSLLSDCSMLIPSARNIKICFKHHDTQLDGVLWLKKKMTRLILVRFSPSWSGHPNLLPPGERSGRSDPLSRRRPRPRRPAAPPPPPLRGGRPRAAASGAPRPRRPGRRHRLVISNHTHNDIMEMSSYFRWYVVLFTVIVIWLFGLTLSSKLN